MKLSMSAITQPVRAAFAKFADMISNFVARVCKAASRIFSRNKPAAAPAPKSLENRSIKDTLVEAIQKNRVTLVAIASAVLPLLAGGALCLLSR